MFRVARAEMIYGWRSLLAWFALLLVTAMWSLFEAPSVSTLPTVLAALTMALPLMAAVVNFRFLSTEKNERRVRLFRALPITTTQLATARLLRSLILPAMGVAVALVLIGVGSALAGTEFTSRLAGAWVLVTLLFLSVAASLFSTLLYDIAGMSFAQITCFGIGGALLFLASSPVLRDIEAESLTRLAQSPLGAILAVLLCVLLAAGDMIVFRRRSDAYLS